MADDDGNLKRGSGTSDAPPKKGGKGVKAWVADHKGATVGIIGIIVTLILYERSKSSSSTAAPAAGSGGGAAQPAATGVGAGTSTPSVDPNTSTYDVSPNDPIIQALTQGETALQQQIAQVIAQGSGGSSTATGSGSGTSGQTLDQLAQLVNNAPPGTPVAGLTSAEQNAIYAASNPTQFAGPGGAYSGAPTTPLGQYLSALNQASLKTPAPPSVAKPAPAPPAKAPAKKP